MPHGDDVLHGPDVEDDGQYKGGHKKIPLQWTDGKIVQTRYGERRLSKAVADEAFHRAWAACRTDLVAFGFAWQDDKVVVVWEQREHDHISLEALIDSFPDRMAAQQAARAREAQERKEKAAAEAEARRRADEVFITGAREAAVASLRERRWSWARRIDVDEAQEILARPDIDRADAVRLLALVANAARNVARSEGRIAVAHDAEMRLATDPSVQAAAHDAVRAITELDQDWAALQNGVGWSKATTVDGHVLAGLDRLTVEQTSHALRLLRVHRKQVPDRLIPRIFALPVQQAALSLSA